MHSAPAWFGLIVFALVAGARHSTEPDHVLSVTTIMAREGRLATALKTALAWGVGHGLTLVLVGSAILLFKLAMPSWFAPGTELAVAAVLIVLGASSLLSMRHSHVHAHGTLVHSHPHLHLRPARAGGAPLKSFGVGLIHGLDGSAPMALLLASSFADAASMMLFLVVFAASAMAGMVLMALTLGLPAFAGRGYGRFLAVATATGAIAFGVYMALDAARSLAAMV